jgi:hypothetical protein
MLIDILLAAWDRFLANRQIGGVQSKGPTYRVFKLEPEKPVRAVPLFGANFNESFGLDWTNEVGKPKGGIVPKIERENRDGEYLNLETWKPNPNLPSLVSHGHALTYQPTDQQPIRSFSGSVDEKWDGQIRATEPRRSYLSARSREKTVADKITAEWNKTETYDFRG